MEPGIKIAHYEILSAIGKGGMGDVWKAKDTKLGRGVAIKTLPEEFARDADRLARYEREARLLASLNHPNIAATYGLEEHQSPEQARGVEVDKRADIWAFGESAGTDRQSVGRE